MNATSQSKVWTDEDINKLLVAAAVVSVAFLSIMLIQVSWQLPFPRTHGGSVVGNDFFNFWTYGQSAFSSDPGAFYNYPTYDLYQKAIGVDEVGHNWSYPPSIMLLTAPFGYLSYVTSLVLFTLLSIVVFIWVARGDLHDWKLVALALVSPAAMHCLNSGQSSLLTAAVILAAWRLLDKRPILAGILIGCLSLKPQVALMFPFMLLATQRWRVIASAAATCIAIAALTTVLFGFKVWEQFVYLGIPGQNLVLTDPTLDSAAMMPTILMTFRRFGLSYDLSMAIQLVFSAAAVMALLWAFRRPHDVGDRRLFAVFTACTVCASPYLLIYDLVPLTVAAIFLMQEDRCAGVPKLLLLLIYWLPFLQLAMGDHLRMAGPAFLVPVLVGYLIADMRGQRSIQPIVT
ncbi:glycosyltransferase family 87 protein [Roseiarcaceae bacterium H3SJ34-1]|uniref:glycosyltransferase family 87 protein n=1 Tax=Terripilifer ovatus TaxID=3032367 RepID=UPI003AB9B174|nr:glycosyltransferase family 87 protein [Roseiarcaceae bacterium H3SJ34-1]